MVIVISSLSSMSLSMSVSLYDRIDHETGCMALMKESWRFYDNDQIDFHIVNIDLS